MKHRDGFVSNSSSTSFCIYGAYLDGETVKEFLRSKGEQVEEDDGNLDDDSVSELLQEYLNKTGHPEVSADTHYPDGGEGIKVGREYADIENNETGLQFKASVDTVLNEIDPSVKAAYQSESWYN